MLSSQLIIKSLVRRHQFAVVRLLSDKTPIQNTEATISTATVEESDSPTKVGGFAQSFEKQQNISQLLNDKPAEENLSFPTLLRRSKFIDMGDPEGKFVNGKIFHIVGDDLYIDFGWKFHCVCTRPVKGGSEYVRGARVKLRIKSLELSTKFLGSSKDLTILEADCQLLGLLSSSAKQRKSKEIEV